MNNALWKVVVVASVMSVFGCDNSDDKQPREAPFNADVSRTDMSEIGESGQTPTHQAIGTVSKVDKQNNHVVVDLEPVPELNWPAEPKPFEVEDENELNDIQLGDKVEVSFVEEAPGRYVAQDLTER